jgi:hypothetical protein
MVNRGVNRQSTMVQAGRPCNLCRVDAFRDHRFNSASTTRNPNDKKLVAGDPKAKAAILSMSRLETAMNRLDAAMARLDAAVNDSAQTSDRDRATMERDLAALRETHGLLQEEARLVSDRLDIVVGRLHNVMAGSL